MRRYLLAVAAFAILAMAAADAIWPSPPPLLIDDATIAASAPIDRQGITADAKMVIKPPPDPIARAKFKGEDIAIVDGLAFVNKTVNGMIQGVDDQSHYGVIDKWVSWPGDLKGDCEDVAASKLVTLSDAGMPIVEFARLRFVYIPSGGALVAHAIVEARMPNGAIAELDSHFDVLMTRRELEAAGYKFFDW